MTEASQPSDNIEAHAEEVSKAHLESAIIADA